MFPLVRGGASYIRNRIFVWSHREMRVGLKEIVLYGMECLRVPGA
jgi:hypothetical protein